jgi:RecA-family ATPase
MLEASMAIAAAAAGGDLLGLGAPSADRVLYLSLEDTAVVTKNRLHAIGMHLPPDARELVHQGVDILPMFGMGFDVMNESHFDDLIDVCGNGQKPRLIIIDTLSRIASLDFNDPKQARRFMRRVENLAHQTDAAVVYLHHVSKASVRDGKSGDQIAAQGASVLIDDARWGAAISRMSEAEAKQFSESDKYKNPISDDRRAWLIKMSFPKVNYGSPIQDLWFERHEGGVLLPATLFPIGDIKDSANAGPKRNSYQDSKNGVINAGAFGWKP